MSTDLKNIAYIDGQNLHMGTKSGEPSWEIDLARFRQYLARKYNVEKAFTTLVTYKIISKVCMKKFKRLALYLFLDNIMLR